MGFAQFPASDRPVKRQGETVPPIRLAHRSIGRNREGQPERRAAGEITGTSPERPVRADAGDVGAALRQAREQRRISLDGLAQATKIRASVLRAIETNRKDGLPDAFYLRSFVRAYTSEVGLDPVDTVRRYLDQFAPVASVVTTASTPQPEKNERQTVAAIGGGGFLAARNRRLAVAIVLVLIVGDYTAARWQARQLGPSQTSESADATKMAPSSAISPALDRPDIGTAGDVLAANGVLHLKIQAGGSCWLSATVDGTRVLYGLMRTGEQQAVDIHREVDLRVGDPAAFNFSINGVAGRSLGQAGEPVTVHITSANYREFLRRQ